MSRIRKYRQNEETGTFDEIYRRLSVAHARIDSLQRDLDRRHVFSYWIEPEFLNGWANATTVEPFAYRVYSGRFPEFKGHLDASGASSGTVAFTLPVGVDDDDELVIMPRDMFFHTVITPDNGTTFQIALVFIDSTTGDVTITWPAN